MPNQEESRDGIPRKDTDRPTPDVDRYSTDGQSNARGKGASDEQGRPIGLTSDAQPDLVAPSGVNERDHGTANEAKPSDAGDLGAPGAGLSDRNNPSAPEGKDIGFDPGDASAKKVG
ncbi:hypothetical protein [Ramlibacter sp.]|uniref:hypothetical protein n=1 Tax=Ramlibacter sp. TaxID=1917967 RepID=UPI0018237812|nr:hypothetical protein [Ramlibacter sp.]MBA2672851.1 hypothetical protein [Ramlibacter sp.]